MSAPRKILESQDARLLRLGMNMLNATVKRIGGMRLLLRHHPWTSEKKTDPHSLPVNSDIQMPQNVPMPLALLDRLIEEASHRVIYDFCTCRKAFDCRDHREEIGCLLMGDDALESPASLSHEVGVEKAKEHARRGIDARLVPLVGKAKIDVHHHFLPREYISALAGIGVTDSTGVPFPEWSPEISLDLMDRFGIGAATASTSAPGIYFGDVSFSRDLARVCNEASARLVEDHPDRFGALAVLPLPDVDASLDGLEYALDELGLDGVALLSSVDDRHMGDPAYDRLFDELNRRGAVMFMHATFAPGGKPRSSLPPSHILFASDHPFPPELATGITAGGLDDYDGFDEEALEWVYRESALRLFPRLGGQDEA